MRTVVCPVCRQVIKEAFASTVCLPHCDRLGNTCPMSGQPLGATAEGNEMP